MRSLLFVPADDPRKLQKANALPADTLILDLEDGVAPERKPLARRHLAQFLPGLRQTQARILVRVNGLSTSWFAEDLHAACAHGVMGIVLPKVEAPTDVSDIDAVLALLEDQAGIHPGSLRLFASIESAAALLRSEAISRSSRRLKALVFGGEDYCADMGVTRSSGGEELMFARWTLSHVARAAGLAAIDAVYSDFTDDAGLYADCLRARRMGFHGKQAIHPRQIEIVNQAFTPAAATMEWAHRVIEAFEAALKRGESVAVVDGKMVDRPVMLQAKRLLEGVKTEV